MKCKVCGKEIKAGFAVCGECMPAVPYTGWVSVKDRLPDEVERDDEYGWSARVLVATPKGVGLSHYCYDGDDSEWCSVDRVDGMGIIDGEVTRWMPLPTPPKEDNNHEETI